MLLTAERNKHRIVRLTREDKKKLKKRVRNIHVQVQLTVTQQVRAGPRGSLGFYGGSTEVCGGQGPGSHPPGRRCPGNVPVVVGSGMVLG